MKRVFKIGDWVSWHSKTRKRFITGQIADFRGKRALIFVATWDGRGHHWIEPLWKLRKREELCH